MNDDTARDVTGVALAAGWALNGLKIMAREVADEVASPYDVDCYTATQVAEWDTGAWSYCGVIVDVVDGDGRHWGTSLMMSIERGYFTVTDENDNVKDTREIDPLTEDYPLNELIPEALNYAAENLSSFVLPTIIAPDDKRPS